MRRRRRMIIIMRRRWRGRGGMRSKRHGLRYSGGQPGGGGRHDGQITFGPFCHLCSSPAAPASRFFPPRRS